MRGEQYLTRTSTEYCVGSPPLARGTADGLYVSTPDPGITPACAGNSKLFDMDKLFGGDHPRLRGEQAFGCRGGYGAGGSPPLARGTGPASVSCRAFCRITPACAGNRAPCAFRRRQLSDHPRLRGEQHAKFSGSPLSPGSPPLARGTARKKLTPWRLGRITPACAGNSAEKVDTVAAG